MRKVRALLAAAVLMCGLLWIGADVFGADNLEMQVSSGTTEAAPGEDITLTFSLAGYDDIQEGIYALEATLEYDTDIFETVEEPDFETLSGWEQLRYNADNGQFAVINKNGSVEDEAAFQLTLTAKAQTEIKETTITLKNVSVSEGKEDISLEDTEYQMAVDSDEQPENGGGEDVPEEPDETPEDSDEQPEIPEENPEETPERPDEVPDGTGEVSGDDNSSVEDDQNGMSENIEDSQTNADSEDPVQMSTEQQSGDQEKVQTGDTTGGLIFFAMLLLVSLSVLGGILVTRTRKRKQNKNGPKILAGLILCSILAVSAGIRTEAAREKGDVDRDGSIDYTDVELIQKHLIDLEILGQDAQEPADLNDDGKLTVTDLALLVRMIENRTDDEIPPRPGRPVRTRRAVGT